MKNYIEQQHIYRFFITYPHFSEIFVLLFVPQHKRHSYVGLFASAHAHVDTNASCFLGIPYSKLFVFLFFTQDYCHELNSHANRRVVKEIITLCKRFLNKFSAGKYRLRLRDRVVYFCCSGRSNIQQMLPCSLRKHIFSY